MNYDDLLNKIEECGLEVLQIEEIHIPLHVEVTESGEFVREVYQEEKYIVFRDNVTLIVEYGQNVNRYALSFLGDCKLVWPNEFLKGDESFDQNKICLMKNRFYRYTSNEDIGLNFPEDQLGMALKCAKRMTS